MPLQAPLLDDRSYDQIKEQILARIPRYTPEWRDFNESDPGIVLIELFSWLTESILYQLNRLPELNYIKFLQLLGIELKPAQPAKAELTFTLARDDVETVTVPKGTQVAVSDSGEDELLIFETEESLIALGATLEAIQVFDGFSYTVETTSNESADQSFEPAASTARRCGLDRDEGTGKGPRAPLHVRIGDAVRHSTLLEL